MNDLPSDVQRLIFDKLSFREVFLSSITCKMIQKRLSEDYFKLRAIRDGFAEFGKPDNRSWLWCWRATQIDSKFGKLKTAQGFYCGEISDGYPHGFGVEFYDVFGELVASIGTWNRGKMNGDFTIVNQSPTTIKTGRIINNFFVGTWRCFLPQSNHVLNLVYVDGNIVFGTYDFGNGAMFSGEMVAGKGGKMLGRFGTLILPPGMTYVGQVKSGEDNVIYRHGSGIATYKDGYIVQGYWNKGIPISYEDFMKL